jgi:hypothetical protein
VVCIDLVQSLFHLGMSNLIVTERWRQLSFLHIILFNKTPFEGTFTLLLLDINEENR